MIITKSPVVEPPTEEQLLEQYEAKLAELSAIQAQIDYYDGRKENSDQRVFLDSRAYKRAYNQCLDQVLWY